MAWAIGRMALFCALLPAASATADPVALSVESDGPLPGFGQSDAAPFLADQMRIAGLQTDWIFTGAAAHGLPDRIEWHLQLDPYAGGNVRTFIPMPGLHRQFGNHHLLTARVELYLDGEYQTSMFGQALIDGGARDKALTDFVQRMAQGVLGAAGAYRAIDMAAPKPHS